MKIVHFHRKPHNFHFSIEAIFNELRKNFDKNLEIDVVTCPELSTGLIRRIKNILFASRNQGDINHITGDVHYLALGLPKKSTILTIHDCGFMGHKNIVARFILKIFWLKLPLNKISYVTTVSEATKMEILRYVPAYPPEKIVVIPNFIFKRFKPFPKEFNQSNPCILQIGTKANKNLHRSIKALAGIICRITIVGERRSDLVSLLHEYDIDYKWVERISEEELLEYYKKSDIILFPSILEGFGMPILEAQSIGRPVITGNVSSMPEIAGAGACLVDPFNIQSIRNGILRVIEDDVYRANLVTSGFDNVNRFSIDKVVGKYNELYHKIYNELDQTRVSHI